MQNFLPIALILLARTVLVAFQQWTSCYCTGKVPEDADRVALFCCQQDSDGVTFPNFPHDVKGRWDGRVCNFEGPVMLEISENDASDGFATCCKGSSSGTTPIWGGACFTPGR
ncbi:hypothetical protein Ptr902_05213 [Pyrenophora tritici-repentis]|nr:hypothetical protein Ptr902_05213 [Pyrenophora tritici-repentis]